MSKNQNEQNNIENPAMEEIMKPKKICQSNCKICNSEKMKIIHDLRIKDGKIFPLIVEVMKKQYNEILSTSSLSRHFKNYRDQVQLMSAEIINNDMVEQATAQSVHVQKIVKLIDICLSKIEVRMKNDSMNVDISDLDKLVNMRYKVLSGESNDDDLVGLFQQASEKHGFQQAMTFRRS